jgi:hypothetical protein
VRTALALLLSIAVLAGLPAGAPRAAGQDRAREALATPVPAHVRQRLGPPVPLRQLGGALGEAGRGIAALLRERWKVEARDVPVYVVDRRTLAQLERSISRRDRAHPRLRGFVHRGVVYLGGDHAEVNETLTHELLHALSGRFTRQAHARGHSVFVEGVTQYLTRETGVGAQFKSRGLRRRGSAYGMYLRFAERIADVVGDDVLAASYFHHGLDHLEREVDRVVGPGRLARALRHLDRDDLGGAYRALGAAASHPFDGVWLDD